MTDNIVRFDLHMHSKYSFDSLTNPMWIIKMMKWKGYHVISITDHDNMKVYQNIPRVNDLLIIKGMEIKTDFGDVIGLFLTEEIKSYEYLEVVDEIRSQGGIIVLPHPYRRKKCDVYHLAKEVDLIEIYNSRSSPSELMKSYRMAKDLSIPYLAGSDAHHFFEYGNALNEISWDLIDEEDFRKILLSKNRILFGKKSIIYYMRRIKRVNYILSKFWEIRKKKFHYRAF